MCSISFYLWGQFSSFYMLYEKVFLKLNSALSDENMTPFIKAWYFHLEQIKRDFHIKLHLKRNRELNTFGHSH